jgi:hypothetical protein
LKRPFINSNSTVHKEKEMVDFRKALLLLAVLVFATGFASAQALNCTLNGGAPPLLRAEGVAEEIGQAFITCTGGTVGNVQPVNIRLFTNGYNITSKLLNSTTSEAMLLIDDPVPGTQVVGTNMYFASPVAGNPTAIEWTNIPFNPPGTVGTRVLRFVNIRVNAAKATGGNVTSLIPPPVNIFLAFTGTFTLPITSPFLAVGYIQNGLNFTVTPANFAQCGSGGTFTARFTELFPNAFRIRGNIIAQNDLTQIYNTESMFWGPWTGPFANNAGVATQGTRLKLTFTGIPSGVALTVPTTIVGTLSAALVAVGVDGNTASPTTGAVALSGGAGAAVYEVTTALAGTVETLNVLVTVSWSTLPSLGSGSVAGSYAPLSTTDVAVLESTAPVPRFYQNPTATAAFSIFPCETRLLFPFVSSAAGFDTGIAISNTTVDPFNTPAQSGPCTLFFYGTPANSQQTSASIAAGAQLLMTLTNGNSAQNLSAVPNFTGYMIARCNFQYGHGYAFISDLGANKFAQGYIALVLGGGLTSRYALNPSEALDQ